MFLAKVVSFTRVGGRTMIRVDVRIISGAARDLMTEIAENRFREDLYYRLNVVPVHIPPLRERRDDIVSLCDHYIRRYAADRRVAPPEISSEAMAALSAYTYPGNVRELENILERATALCVDGKVELDDLQLAVESGLEGAVGRDGETLDSHINRIEKQVILEALAKTGFNRTAAARLLGVTFRSLRYRIERLGIEE